MNKELNLVEATKGLIRLLVLIWKKNQHEITMLENQQISTMLCSIGRDQPNELQLFGCYLLNHENFISQETNRYYWFFIYLFFKCQYVCTSDYVNFSYLLFIYLIFTHGKHELFFTNVYLFFFLKAFQIFVVQYDTIQFENKIKNISIKSNLMNIGHLLIYLFFFIYFTTLNYIFSLIFISVNGDANLPKNSLVGT